MRLLNLPRWLVALVIVLAIGLTAALFSRLPTSNEISGTLVLNIPGQWTAPSGEAMSGFVSYTPSSKQTYQVALPEVARGLAPLALSPSGGDLLATRTAFLENGRDSRLVRFSFPNASEETIAPLSAGASNFTNAAWSPDEKFIAYGTVQWNNVASTSETSAYVLDRTTQKTFPIGSGVPLLFSPDSKTLLLLEGKDKFVFYVPAPGTSTDGGAAAPTIGPYVGVRVSADGAYLALFSQGDAPHAYHVDWLAHTVSGLGTVGSASNGENVVLGRSGEALVAGSDGVAFYKSSDSSFIKAGKAAMFELPAGTTFAGWYGFEK